MIFDEGEISIKISLIIEILQVNGDYIFNNSKIWWINHNRTNNSKIKGTREGKNNVEDIINQNNGYVIIIEFS